MGTEYRLTPRQISVLELVAKGLTNTEIAGVLAIKPGTVKTHVSAIIAALDVTNRTEAAIAFRSHADEAPSPPSQDGRRWRWNTPVRLCVRPLRYLSSPPLSCRDVAVGLTEDLIDELAAVPGVLVTARNSAFLFPDGTASIPDISRVLGVDAVIEGSVRRSGDRVCVITRLIAARGELVWSRRYDQHLDEPLALQQRIASHVAHELKIEMGRLDAAVRPGGTERNQARELYWQGRVAWNQRTPQGAMRAVQLFRAAIELDPSYDAAHVGLADALNHIGAYATIDPRTAFAAARDAVGKALSITPDLGAALASAGYTTLFGDWDVTAAEERLRRALRFAPGYALAHGWLSLLLLIRMRYDEALEESRRGRELDPLSIAFLVHEGRVLYSAGRRAEAIQVLRRALDMDPRNARANGWLALALVLEGHTEEALEASERAVAHAARHPLMLANLGCVLGLVGRRQAAQVVLDELVARRSSAYVSSFCDALVLAGCGDVDGALGALSRATDERAPLMLHLPSEPAFVHLHGAPGYRQLLDRVGLWPARPA